MVENEYPYLDRPERLEYPTESWAAQEIRKSDVFALAAMHADGDERHRFIERSEFFSRVSTESLWKSKTRAYARPIVLLLSNGAARRWLAHHPEARAPAPARTGDFGEPEAFVPQRIRAMRRAALTAAGALVASLAYVLVRVLS